jgi:hypothetical protein
LYFIEIIEFLNILQFKFRTMKKKNFLLVPGILFLLVWVTSCSNNQKTGNDNSVAVVTQEDLVKRGEYLVTIMGCNDCHSPKRMGANGPEIIPELMLSGYPADRPIVKFDTTWTNKGFAVLYPDLTAAAGPWGVSFAGNLTPDPTGTGNWTEEQFKIALTQGWFKGVPNSRKLLPPMPWFNFVNIKDEDVKAIFAYLKSLPPVSNLVPAPIPPNGM